MALAPTFFSKASWDLWQLKTARTWHDLEDTYHTVHHLELDKEHLVLVDLVLELNSMIDRLKETSFSLDFIYQIAEVCDRLHQRLSEHFELEEQVLEELQIPDHQVHHEQHQKILHEIEVLLQDLMEGKFAVNLEFKNQILEWTLEHMLSEDYKAFTPKNIALYLFKCPDFEKTKNWLPKLGLGFDAELNEITKLMMAMYHHRENHVAKLTRLMESCFIKEERILIHYLAKGVVSLHVRKHREMLALIKASSNFSVEKLFQLWLSHLIMRDKEDFRISHWLHNDIYRFIEVKATSLGADYDEINLKIAKNMKELGNTLYLMVDLSKNSDEMKQLSEKFKQLVSILRTIFEDLFEKESQCLTKLKKQECEIHLKRHEELCEKMDLLVLLIESHQLALASFHLKDFQEIWCIHRCFDDPTDLVRE